MLGVLGRVGVSWSLFSCPPDPFEERGGIRDLGGGAVSLTFGHGWKSCFSIYTHVSQLGREGTKKTLSHCVC